MGTGSATAWGQMTLLGRHEAFLLAALVLRDGRSDVQGDHPGITI
jgi:hypothetical protein